MMIILWEKKLCKRAPNQLQIFGTTASLIMASKDAASWLEIMKDRSSRQIEQPPPLQSKISDPRIPNNPRPLTRQDSQRSINTLSVYPARGLNRSSSAANVRRRSGEKPFARPPLPGQKDLPLRRPSKNTRPSDLDLGQGTTVVLKKDALKADRDFSSRTSRVATPRGRRTARPDSFVTSSGIQRSNTKKIPNPPPKLASRSPLNLSPPLPISPRSRQGPTEEMFSDSGSLPSPNLGLVEPVSGVYPPETPSLAPAPLNFNSNSKKRAAPRPDSTTIPAFEEPSPAISPSSRYSPEGESAARNGSAESKLSSAIPGSLSSVLFNSPSKLSLWKQSDFIRVAGNGEITLTEVSRYLIQERFYLQSLTRFLGLLLANVLLPTKPSGLVTARVVGVKERAMKAARQAETNLLASRITSLSRGEVGASTSSRLAGMKARVAAPAASVPILVQPVSVVKGPAAEPEGPAANVKADTAERFHDWLVARLLRVRKELDLIDEMAEDFPSLDELWDEGASDVTNGLTRLFTKLGNAIEKKGKNILTGLVLLLAREKAHCDVWRKIGASLASPGQNSNDKDEGVTRSYLGPTFTSVEAVQSVHELEQLVDLVWQDRRFAEASTLVQRTEEGEASGWKDELKEFEMMWDMVLDIQSRFWPYVS
jgi:hypothetical protein